MDPKTKRQRILNNKRDVQELNDILNQWDFLGVVKEGRSNEYYDLYDPILNSLYDNANSSELLEIIHKVVEDQYGLTLSKSSTDEVAEKIIKWWSVRKEQLKTE